MKFCEILICRLVMAVLFRALKVLIRRDGRVKAIAAAYPDGFSCRLRAGIGADKPTLSFMITDGGAEKIGNDGPVDLDITIKSLTDAVRLFTGRLGVARAYAEHRFYLKGNPFDTMGLVRSIEIAESYLFPKFIASKLMVAKPEREFNPIKLFVLMAGV